MDQNCSQQKKCRPYLQTISEQNCCTSLTVPHITRDEAPSRIAEWKNPIDDPKRDHPKWPSIARYCLHLVIKHAEWQIFACPQTSVEYQWISMDTPKSANFEFDHDNILQLNVPMDNPFIMEGIYYRRNLGKNSPVLFERVGAIHELIVERRPVGIFENRIEAILRVKGVAELDKERISESRSKLELMNHAYRCTGTVCHQTRSSSDGTR
jgi:hypothetical protein